MSATDEEVLSAAEAFGEELAESQSDGASSEFETLLEEFNDAISETTGLNYGSICSTDNCC